jgi:hypothetical protein
MCTSTRGGQAGRGYRKIKKDQPHALEHAPGEKMQSRGKEREAVASQQNYARRLLWVNRDQVIELGLGGHVRFDPIATTASRRCNMSRRANNRHRSAACAVSQEVERGKLPKPTKCSKVVIGSKVGPADFA